MSEQAISDEVIHHQLSPEDEKVMDISPHQMTTARAPSPLQTEGVDVEKLKKNNSPRKMSAFKRFFRWKAELEPLTPTSDAPSSPADRTSFKFEAENSPVLSAAAYSNFFGMGDASRNVLGPQGKLDSHSLSTLDSSPFGNRGVDVDNTGMDSQRQQIIAEIMDTSLFTVENISTPTSEVTADTMQYGDDVGVVIGDDSDDNAHAVSTPMLNGSISSARNSIASELRKNEEVVITESKIDVTADDNAHDDEINVDDDIVTGEDTDANTATNVDIDNLPAIENSQSSRIIEIDEKPQFLGEELSSGSQAVPHEEAVEVLHVSISPIVVMEDASEVKVALSPREVVLERLSRVASACTWQSVPAVEMLLGVSAESRRLQVQGKSPSIATESPPLPLPLSQSLPVVERAHGDSHILKRSSNDKPPSSACESQPALVRERFVKAAAADYESVLMTEKVLRATIDCQSVAVKDKAMLASGERKVTPMKHAIKNNTYPEASSDMTKKAGRHSFLSFSGLQFSPSPRKVVTEDRTSPPAPCVSKVINGVSLADVEARCKPRSFQSYSANDSASFDEDSEGEGEGEGEGDGEREGGFASERITKGGSEAEVERVAEIDAEDADPDDENDQESITRQSEIALAKIRSAKFAKRMDYLKLVDKLNQSKGLPPSGEVGEVYGDTSKSISDVTGPLRESGQMDGSSRRSPLVPRGHSRSPSHAITHADSKAPRSVPQLPVLTDIAPAPSVESCSADSVTALAVDESAMGYVATTSDATAGSPVESPDVQQADDVALSPDSKKAGSSRVSSIFEMFFGPKVSICCSDVLRAESCYCSFPECSVTTSEMKTDMSCEEGEEQTVSATEIATLADACVDECADSESGCREEREEVSVM